MLFSKSKILIYTIIFIFILSFLLPICTYAIDKNSVYVWSSNVPSVSTSNTSDSDSLENNNEYQDNSR